MRFCTKCVTPTVLGVGSGSIGMRHIGNLRALGIERILAHDPAPEQLTVAVVAHGVTPSPSLDEVLGHQPDAVFICTPPHLHILLANTLEGVDRLAHPKKIFRFGA